MYYVYQITNLINQKIYIGYHYSLNIEDDKYLGSGKLIIKAVKKYGVKNFKREILFSYENIVDALNKERELVNFEFVRNRKTYNCVLGGKGGFPYYSRHGIPHNKNKIGIFNFEINKQRYVKESVLQEYLNMGWVVGTNFRNTTVLFDNHLQKYTYIPKDLVDAYLRDSRFVKLNTTSNKKVMHHVETKQLKYVNPNDIQTYSDQGYILGNVKSGINKNRIYVHNINTKKNKRIIESQVDSFLKENPDFILGFHIRPAKFKNVYNSDTNEERHVNLLIENIDDYLNNGFTIGSRNRKKSKRNDYLKNSIWIHNFNSNPINKRIKSDELEYYLQLNWIKGFYNQSQSQK